MTPKKPLLEIADPLSREIINILLEEDRSLRNKTIIDRLKKRQHNEEIKSIVSRTTPDSLRVQITNRLQRLWKEGIIEKNIISPKEVRYHIKDVKDAQEKVDKEIFKQSLGELRFQKVELETEIDKIIKTIAKDHATHSKRHLSVMDKFKLRDPARLALWETSWLAATKVIGKPCKVYIIYPTNIPAPIFKEDDIKELYNVFLTRSVGRRDNIKATTKRGFSILFQYSPMSSKRETGYMKKLEKTFLALWLQAKNADAPSKEMLSKFQQDKDFVLDLFRKTTEKVQDIVEKSEKHKSLA